MELSIDLNLLRTFVAVYRARNITRAAKTLHLSQPAVSHALGRLRNHFDDPLFVRTRSGVAPTRLAISVYAEVNGPLSQIVASTEDLTRFDPATSTRRFRIALTDLGEAGLLPRILRVTGNAGSGIQIETVPFDIETAAQDVLSRHIDAAIGSSPVRGPVAQEVLFHDRYGCLVPEDLEAQDGVVSVDDLRRLPEVRVGPSAGHRTMTEAVTTLGAGILLDVPHVEVNRFTSLPPIVAQCGFFAVVPVGAFSSLIPRLEGTKLLELPFSSPHTGVHLIAHRDAESSSAHVWFLGAIREALSDP